MSVDGFTAMVRLSEACISTGLHRGRPHDSSTLEFEGSIREAKDIPIALSGITTSVHLIIYRNGQHGPLPDKVAGICIGDLHLLITEGEAPKKTKNLHALIRFEVSDQAFDRILHLSGHLLEISPVFYRENGSKEKLLVKQGSGELASYIERIHVKSVAANHNAQQ